MREYHVPSGVGTRFVLYVESKTKEIFEPANRRSHFLYAGVKRETTRTIISREVAAKLIHGTPGEAPAQARWVQQERVRLIFPNGRREIRLISVCKKFAPPKDTASSGSARMSPPAMVRKRSNKLRGRGRATRNGDWRRSAYEALLAKEMAGDVLAAASLDGWKFIRFRRRNAETGEVLVDPKTGEALPEEFGNRWLEVDHKGRVIPAGVKSEDRMAVSERSVLFLPAA